MHWRQIGFNIIHFEIQNGRQITLYLYKTLKKDSKIT